MANDNIGYARRLNHPPSLGWAFASCGYLNYFLAEPKAALDYVEEGARYCEANNVAVWGIHCRLFEAWAKASSGGDLGSNIDAMRKAIGNARSRTSLGIPLFRAILADSLSTIGQLEEAITEIGGAVDDLIDTGQHFFSPIIYYVRASCIAKLGREHAGESEKWYARSAQDAQRMKASLLELRAYSALVRGNCDLVLNFAALARSYNQIEEKSDIACLQVARDLLQSRIAQ